MKKEIFEGLKYTVINALITEYQKSKDIEYRNELLEVINILNNFLNYNKFEENCKTQELPIIKGDNILKIRNIAVSSIYNAQIESIEKNIILVELTKFFSKSIDPQQIEKIIKK